MNLYHRIVLATDFTGVTRNAVSHALQLAARSGADLHLLHVEIPHEHGTRTDEHAFEGTRAATEHELRDLALHYDGPRAGRVLKASVRNMEAAAGIREYAVQQGADLIVAGTHARRGVSRVILGSVARDLAAISEVPVLVASQHEAQAVHPHGFLRILAPVDFSPASARALAHAAALAQAESAHLYVLHAIDLLRQTHVKPAGAERTSVRDAWNAESDHARRERLAGELDRFIEAAALPVQAEPIVQNGRAEDCILEVARLHDVHLIVMPPSGLSALDRLLLGSVTARVLDAAPCPVLVFDAAPAEHLPRPAAIGAQATAAP